MRKGVLIVLAVAAVLGLQTRLRAHEGKMNLPPGPLRDRHELMEGIGKQAKAIGNALKAGDTKPVGPAAEAIHSDAAKILPLFPPGSTHPDSRAKPEIWANWKDFEAGAKELERTSGDLAAAATDSSNVGAAADKMFDTCKGCHEKFRVPEKKK